MRRIVYISTVLIFIVISESKAQQQFCDCPYPIVFVHGWNGAETSWESFSKYLSPLYGDSIEIPTIVKDTGTVYYAHLNWSETSTKIEDDVVVHEQFLNAPVLRSNRCMYAISFDTKKPLNVDSLLASYHHDFSNVSIPSGQSASNQSSIIKQGYALGKAIKKILEITGKQKVILVAHSMGGLESREYLQRKEFVSNTHPWWVYPSESDGHRVAKLLTVGTPHLGSNTGNASILNSIGSLVYNVAGLDEMSEAVRDMRYSYDSPSLLYNDKPGVYMFGGNEGVSNGITNPEYMPIAAFDNFKNYDVNCDNDNLDTINITNNTNSINQPGPQIWDGTEPSYNMPLPTNVKYTYYVANFFGSPGIGYGNGGDGVVDDMRQWLYFGGNGNTLSFNNGNSKPRPYFNKEYLLSDRYTSLYRVFHMLETDDHQTVQRGLDEADFPYYAYEINIDTAYSGMALRRADIVADSSNILIPGATSTQDPNIDTDWYKFKVNSTHTGNYKFLLNKTSNLYFRVEIFNQEPPVFANRLGSSLYSATSPENNNSQIVVDLNNLAVGDYWIRITSKIPVSSTSLNNYSFRIHDPSFCINPNPQLVSEDCGFLTHDKAIKLNGEIGLEYSIQTIPDIGQNGNFVDCGFPMILQDIENKSPISITFTNTLNPACSSNYTIQPSESACDFHGLGLCNVPDILLSTKQKDLKEIFCDEANCEFIPANPLNSGNRMAMSMNSELPSTLQAPLQNLYVNYLYEEATLGKKIEYFGSLYSNENINEIEEVFNPYFINNIGIDYDDSLQILAEMAEFDIPSQKVGRLILKWNNSLVAYSNGVYSPDSTYQFIMDKTAIDSFQSLVDLATDYVLNNGYPTIDSMYENSINTINNYSLENDPTINPVCASVGISLSQKLTMTREAFEGTLKIFNGATDGAMDSISLNLEIKDEAGVLSNHLFEIETSSLTALTGISGTGQLAANTEGIAKILFIPEPAAAPTLPRFYSFGGSISYKDPFSNTMVTMPLSPVTLQVNPSPDLFLHYFMERDILGDDAFTTDVEPSIPARLAVMIENDGYGTANNLKIQSAQPQVIDNEKGLALQMNLIGSKLQGGPTNWGLTNIDFGSIPPLATRVGEWLFTSNLLGHFTGYTTNVRHLSSRGNPDLSLVSGAQLHELIHSVKIYGSGDDGILDFLTNEVQDANDKPDALYDSRGNIVNNVKEASSGQFLNPIMYPTFTTSLQVTPQDSGWFYLKLNDPGQGEYTIVSVTRNSDGQVIPLDNVWLTYVTIPDTRVQQYEDKFHFVDFVPNNTTRTYTVVWSPKDPNPPKIDTILNVPQNIVGLPHVSLTVVFSEPIEDSTFTIADISLTRQGSTILIDTAVVITKIDSVSYEIIMNGLTDLSGYYVFTAQAAGVVDKTGVPGTTGKSVNWVQNLTGPIVTEFSGVTNNHLYQSVDTLLVEFNMPIDTAFLSVTSFRMKKGSNYLPDTLQFVLSDNQFKKFKFVGLDLLTDEDSMYKFVVDLSQVKSTTGIQGQDSQLVNFVIDKTGPIIMSITLTTESALDNQHKTGVLVTLDQPILSLSESSFALYMDNTLLEDTLIDVHQINATTYKLFWGAETFEEGTYKFEITADSLYDIVGNQGNGMDSLLWTIDRTSNMEISDIIIVPDLGFSNTDKITSNRNIALHYHLNEKAYNAKVKYIDNGTEHVLVSSTSLLMGEQINYLSLPVIGHIFMKIEALDTFGNVIDTIFPVYIDEVDLTGSWLGTQNQIVYAHPDSLLFKYNDPVLNIGVVSNIHFPIYRNNILITNQNISFNRLNDTMYVLSGLNALPQIPGIYRVDLSLDTFSKYLTGRHGNGIVSFTWEIFDPNLAPIANAGPDQIIKDLGQVFLDGSLTYDPESNEIHYKWISLDDVALSNDSIVNPTFIVDESRIGKVLTFLLIASDSSKSSSDIVRVFVELDDILVKVKVFLEGPYISTEGLMKDSLRSKNLIPENTPYVDTALYKFGNDNKSISNSNLTILGNDAIVDWIYIELYDINADSALRGGSYLLQRDGDIVDTLSTKTPIFENLLDGEYAIRVFHRNHLPIMTSNVVILNRNAIKNVDLTQSVNNILGSINAVKLISGKYTMIGGDVNQNGQIQQTDIIQTMPKIGQSGYLIEDVDMNGEIQNTDIYLYILPNLGKGKQF